MSNILPPEYEIQSMNISIPNTSLYDLPQNYVTNASQIVPAQPQAYNHTPKNHKVRYDYVIFDYENRKMFSCHSKISAKVVDVPTPPFGNIQSHFLPNSKTITSEYFQIAIGCADFINLNRHCDEEREPLYCRIRISSKIKDDVIEVPCTYIYSKSKSLKILLEQYGVCFTDKKSFGLWCNDILNRIHNCCVISHVSSDFNFVNERWHLTSPSSNLSYSEQESIIFSLRDKLSNYNEGAFEEITLIFYGVLGKMFTVLLNEGFTDIANLLIVNRDLFYICRGIKECFPLSDDDIIRSKGEHQKELCGRSQNNLPLIVVEGSKYMVNKVVNEYGGSFDIKCLPIFAIGKLDDIANNDMLLNYFTLNINHELSGNIGAVIKIFLGEIFGDNYLFDSIKDKALTFSANCDDVYSVKRKNLFSLLTALAQTVLPRIGIQNVEDLSRRYLDYLSQTESVDLLNLEKLKNLLKSSPNYKRVLKSEACETEDGVLYIGNETVSVNSSTMLNIANELGFDSVNSFAVCLNENECLKTFEKSYMDSIHINGRKKRVYSFKLSSLFSFGELLPCKEITYDKPVISIPIGKTADGEIVSLPIIKDDNNSMFISGQSGVGKTNLCNFIAQKAFEKGFNVLVIGKDTSIKDLAANVNPVVVIDKENHIPWNEFTKEGITKIVTLGSDPKLLDSVLERFFKHKTLQAASAPTLLILDEIQDFTWDGNSIIKQLLRQGRKYNIIPVMSTQFLDSDNGTNIGDVLRQVNTFCCFKNGIFPKQNRKNYPKLQNCVENLDMYEALIFEVIDVNGAIVKLPIKFKTEKAQ